MLGPSTGFESTDEGDRALVARAQAGENSAFDEIVRRHQRWIYNVAARMLYHPQDAEDATQAVLVKALTRGGARGREGLTFGCYAHGLGRTISLMLW
jgi:DNA-directed RNA polymerase specialized sigma24 family protein